MDTSFPTNMEAAVLELCIQHHCLSSVILLPFHWSRGEDKSYDVDGSKPSKHVCHHSEVELAMSGVVSSCCKMMAFTQPRALVYCGQLLSGFVIVQCSGEVRVHLELCSVYDNSQSVSGVPSD